VLSAPGAAPRVRPCGGVSSMSRYRLKSFRAFPVGSPGRELWLDRRTFTRGAGELLFRLGQVQLLRSGGCSKISQVFQE